MGVGWFLVIQFFSVFSGVFLAYFLGTSWDRAKRREEEEAQQVRAKESIAAELLNVYEGVGRYLREVQPSPGKYVTLLLATDAKDATIGSGAFALIEPETQVQISIAYSYISDAIMVMRHGRKGLSN